MSERDETASTANVVRLPAPVPPIPPEEMRDFNATWLLHLMDGLRPEVLRLQGRTDTAALAAVERAAGALQRATHALAGAAHRANQLTLESPRTHKTARAGR